MLIEHSYAYKYPIQINKYTMIRCSFLYLFLVQASSSVAGDFQVTSHKNGIQKSDASDLHELSVVTGGQYKTPQPRIEGTATSEGPYQSLVRSNRSVDSVPSSNI